MEAGSSHAGVIVNIIRTNSVIGCFLLLLSMGLVANGEPKAKSSASLRTHKHWVFCLDVLPDGKTGGAGRRDQTIKFWRIPGGKESRTLKGHVGSVCAVRFSPDGKLLASGGGDLPEAVDLFLWDVASGKIKHRLKGPKDVIACLAFSPDGKTLASGDQGGRVRLWDLSGKELASFEVYPELKKTDEAEWAKSLAFSPDGKTLATVGYGGILKVWDLKTRKPILTLNEKKSIWCVAFSRDGKTLTWAGDGEKVTLWDVGTKKVRTTSEELDSPVTSLAFSRDGKALVVGHAAGEGVKVLDAATGKVVASLADERLGGMLAVAFDKEGKHVISGGLGNTVHIWELNWKQKRDDKAGRGKEKPQKEK